MLDINIIRNSIDIVKKDLEKRRDQEKVKWLDDLIKKDRQVLEIKKQIDDLRHERNITSESINKLKKQGKDAGTEIKKAKEIPVRLKELEEKYALLQEKIRYYMMRIPNILHESVPCGKDDTENKEIRKWGKIPKFSFELKPHGELLEKMGLADFQRAAKISGTGFYFLKKELALMDLALQRFAIDFLMQKRFILIEPPLMMNKEAYEGVTSLDDFENVMYKIDKEDLYMIATSEHPMVAMHKDELFEEKDLPLKYVGFSPCFRKEIGSHGVDTRGIFRVHQFNKIEQVVFCKPEDSWKLHEELQKNSELMLQKLNIPYHIVSICTGDIGIVAAKKYDIEAYFPREQKYREVTSCSNCTSYQAVRLNIKYRKDNDKLYVHTLNNTGIATARVLRAIIENYQREDGTINVPTVLQKYMNGIKKIGEQNDTRRIRKKD
ncbi:serine--tRNA ligase [Candidatus Woesearchaeota archaeon]|nr:serine--tRNA ligase [Candidatus Woesearchaeota archaeon]